MNPGHQIFTAFVIIVSSQDRPDSKKTKSLNNFHWHYLFLKQRVLNDKATMLFLENKNKNCGTNHSKEGIGRFELLRYFPVNDKWNKCQNGYENFQKNVTLIMLYTSLCQREFLFFRPWKTKHLALSNPFFFAYCRDKAGLILNSVTELVSVRRWERRTIK